jgi:hypothetical protein
MTIREHHPHAVVPYVFVVRKILPYVLIISTLGAIFTAGGDWLISLAVA